MSEQFSINNALSLLTDSNSLLLRHVLQLDNYLSHVLHCHSSAGLMSRFRDLYHELATNKMAASVESKKKCVDVDVL